VSECAKGSEPFGARLLLLRLKVEMGD